jgi:hypothetical protein
VATITQAERYRLIHAFLALDKTKLYPDGVSYWDKQEDIHKNAHAGGADVHASLRFRGQRASELALVPQMRRNVLWRKSWQRLSCGRHARLIGERELQPGPEYSRGSGSGELALVQQMSGTLLCWAWRWSMSGRRPTRRLRQRKLQSPAGVVEPPPKAGHPTRARHTVPALAVASQESSRARLRHVLRELDSNRPVNDLMPLRVRRTHDRSPAHGDDTARYVRDRRAPPGSRWLTWCHCQLPYIGFGTTK